jgi:hypothetical protein
VDKTIAQGASTTLYGCLAPELDTKAGRGAYLVDCAVGSANSAGTDASGALRKALWAETERQLEAALVAPASS